MKKCTIKLISFAAVAAGSFMMGFGVGYFNKNREDDSFYYESDICEVAEAYNDDEDVDPSWRLKKLNEAKSYIADLGYVDTDGDDPKVMNASLDYWDIAKTKMYSEQSSDNYILTDESYEEVDVKDVDGKTYRMTDDGLVEVKPPYFITEEEYFETQRDFEKTPITYYANDGVYADVRDEMIKNVDDLFPEDCHVGFETDEVVYVRNIKISTDFEISKVDQSYWEDVLGVVEKHNIFEDDREE